MDPRKRGALPNIISSQTSKCKNNAGAQDVDWAILYKGPAQNNGKLLASDSPDAWADGAAVVTQNNGHSFAVALTDVVGNHPNVKFLAYNNIPPAIPNVKTKSNSKGVIIVNSDAAANDGAWIVHTVPGFPAAKTGYSWPAAEIAKGHLLICMTIAETQINAIGMPDFKKLAEGQITTKPPFTISRSIKLTGAGAVPVQIYSKSAKSRYGKAILYKGPAQNTGKLLASDSPGAWVDNAAVVTADAGHSFAVALTHVVGNHANVKFLAYNNVPPGIPNVKTKSSSKGVIIINDTPAVNDAAWIVHTVPGFPAAKTGYSWPAAEIAKGHLLICMSIAENQINTIAASLIRAEPFVYYNDIPETVTAGMPDFQKLAEGQIPSMPPFTARRSIKITAAANVDVHLFGKAPKSRYGKAILYKGPAQNNGKLLASDSPNAWADGAAVVTQNNGHSFAVALTHVVGNHVNVKFLAYNNIPPSIPNVKTKSNSKGVIIINTAAGQNDGAWIVHTVPGFPAAKTGYSWPAAEIAKGHLLICMTIAETQINAVAASLIQTEPFVYYNDIPETETTGMPDFKKLAEGQIPVSPPFTTRRSIKTAAPASVDVHIYSKSAKSKYEIYKKVIVKALKKTIKVWSRRDNKLKGDCRVLQRNIRLIKSPAQIAGHATNIETDESNWIVSEPGNIFCFTDKPYSKNQIKEPGMAVCIDKDAIFARFNAIAAQVENCP
ncbi:Deoxyribonuclease-2-alpha [Trichinella zimbabwensis]|uniref:Deoxyribonuclease-2-alpha n=1 Tax=Trichinella zimbabwensis TaxID=268475 RepID=A0A0V1I1E8_9BILA|nr:Deoxyribonuclease-2-alpha [Trichinella zimbabwensis]